MNRYYDITEENFLAKSLQMYGRVAHATCHSFATTNTFKSQLHYLLSNGYITRIARGVYQITPKGQKYLTLLTS